MGPITTSRRFDIVASNLPGWPDVAVPIAASRAGATGVLNLEETRDLEIARAAISRLAKFGRGTRGVKLRLDSPIAEDLIAALPATVTLLVVTGYDAASLERAIQQRGSGRRVFVECTTIDEARRALFCGADGLVAKGHEAGGHVGEETTFILVQRFVQETSRPVWAYGGIGPHSAAACCAAGCAGVLLDVQFALARESKLPAALKDALERFDGDETVCLGNDLGNLYRVYRRPGMAAVEHLQRLEATLFEGQPADRGGQWRDAIGARIGWERPERELWPLGQDALQAALLARRYGTVAAIIDGITAACRDHLRLAASQRALDRFSPLAVDHQTEYPILQGPMTRVSDTSAFAEAVATNGALPFLALALLRGPQVKELLEETQTRLGGRSWGVGILGFVPLELRQEQLDVIDSVRPPFAIIAGGRPDQAARLEAHGIATYLHVPAPGLLKLFIEDGARRFIFEGRECGGHVGPRTSFVLWESMIDTLLSAIDGGVPGHQLHVVFAGGIHDARSAAMVATMAAPLVERGVHIGVLLGTAYLFTEEAVQGNAIVENFQREAVECTGTVLLESGAGHSTRCVPTPFHDTFKQTKRKLAAEGRPAEEIKAELENLNLGRLRIASKGIARHPKADSGGPRYVPVEADRQHVEGMYMIGQLAGLRGSVCRMSELHEDVSAGSTKLLEEMPMPGVERPKQEIPARPCDVAIIGLGALLPKAFDAPTFWSNILNKVDAITEVPKERFDVDLFYDATRGTRDKVYSRWGGFLDDVPFDPMRYGIPPASLTSIDSLQLLSLEAARQALADAGYLEGAGLRERCSVILGLSGGLGDLGLKYGIRSNLPTILEPSDDLLERLPEWTEDSFAGILLNVAAGRIANRFDLGGVNYTVDAACASSLAAVYLAVQELERRTSDMVIVGGVDTVQSPFGFQCFASAQALSPRGRCRTFDSTADGIAISEGVAMLVLKRLEDAERDGDRIYAVIKGIAGSSDGRGRSLTAPRPEGQRLALERAYAQSGVSPASVGLIEAHGTGTVVGDAAEVAALSEMFQEAGAAPASCAIGSVKSMIGHTKSAAGVTGLMKVALALHHKVLPPTLHVENPNPQLRDPANPFFVNTDARPWISSEGSTPRRAGVSSFGFGGTNFHAVIEEYTGEYLDPLSRKPSASWPAELFVWQGRSAAEIDAALAGVESAIAGDPALPLRTLAARVGKASDAHASVLPLRASIVATDVADLSRKIRVAREALQSGKQRLHDTDGVYIRNEAPSGKLAFLFPGQGSQAPNMLRDLAVAFPHIREALQTADAALAGMLPRPLSTYIFPPPAFTPEERAAQMRAITDTTIAQPALGAIEMGVYSLLSAIGIRPDVVGGHSYGEYVALAASGAISERELYEISSARGRAIADSVAGAPGVMAAVSASAESVATALGDRAEVWVANLNAPSQTIISGTSAGIDAATAALEAAGLRASRIPVACAFHTPLMDGAHARLADALSKLRISTPRVPVFSNTTAQPYPDDPSAIRALLSSHLVKPVNFVDEVRAMYDAGVRTFVEAGPKTVLSALTRQNLDQRQADIISVDSSDRPGVTQLLHLLAQCAAAGHVPRLATLFEGREETEMQSEQRARAAKATWVVSGSGARPANQPVKMYTPIPQPSAASVPQHDTAPAVAMPAAATAAAPAGDAVMLQFQNMMSQFLQTQAAVVTAYLQGGNGAIVPSAINPVAAAEIPAVFAPVPAPIPVAVQPVAPAAAAPPPPSAPIASPAAATRDIAADLLRLVSDRTGYPADMLNPDLNIEADLGIDSIKRVEILSAFQRTCSADEQRAIQPLMDRLTSLKTLRQIADAIGEAVAGSRVASAAAAAPAAVAPAVARDVLVELVQLVSERTGYPVEMLDPDLNIEADLGIDSIKRVEILSTFQRRGSPDEQRKVHQVMDTLTSRKTLRDLSAALVAALEGAAAGAAPRPLDNKTLSPEPEGAASDVPRFVMQPVEAPLLEAPRAFPGRVSLITDDEHGLATGMATMLAERHERPVLLRHGASVAVLGENRFQANLTDENQIKEVLAAIRRAFGKPNALVHLLPLKPAASLDQLSLGQWQERVTADVETLFVLVRAMQSDLLDSGPQAGAMVIGATAMGAALNGTPSEFPLSHGGVSGFLKTAAAELPSVACRAVHLDINENASRLLEHMLAEVGSLSGPVEAAYARGKRTTMTPRLAPPARAGVPVDLGPDSVFLITGGARGVTAEIAIALAQAVRPRLILVGKSPLPAAESGTTAGIEDAPRLRQVLTTAMRAADASVKPSDIEAATQRVLRDREIVRNLDAARRAGATVEYVELDVRDDSAFGALIDRIYAEHGRLDVVVHGAGIIEDKLIKDKTPESFERVVRTKTDSAFTLLRKVRLGDLKALMFMSSVTATFGNRGQADYGAANGILNAAAIAVAQRARIRVRAMNWGPWDKTGMVSDDVKRQFATRGIQVIPVAAGAAIAVADILFDQGAEAWIVVGDGPWGEDAARAQEVELTA